MKLLPYDSYKRRGYELAMLALEARRVCLDSCLLHHIIQNRTLAELRNQLDFRNLRRPNRLEALFSVIPVQNCRSYYYQNSVNTGRSVGHYFSINHFTDFVGLLCIFVDNSLSVTNDSFRKIRKMIDLGISEGFKADCKNE